MSSSLAAFCVWPTCPIWRSIVSAAMKLSCGARPDGSFTCPRHLIAASHKSECAIFGLRATTKLSSNNPQLHVRPNSQNINVEPVKSRLACTLLELAGDFGQDIGSGRILIRQKIDQSDLAAMAGIGRESANRINSVRLFRGPSAGWT